MKSRSRTKRWTHLWWTKRRAQEQPPSDSAHRRGPVVGRRIVVRAHQQEPRQDPRLAEDGDHEVQHVRQRLDWVAAPNGSCVPRASPSGSLVKGRGARRCRIARRTAVIVGAGKQRQGDAQAADARQKRVDENVLFLGLGANGTPTSSVSIDPSHPNHGPLPALPSPRPLPALPFPRPAATSKHPPPGAGPRRVPGPSPAVLRGATCVPPPSQCFRL